VMFGIYLTASAVKMASYAIEERVVILKFFSKCECAVQWNRIADNSPKLPTTARNSKSSSNKLYNEVDTYKKTFFGDLEVFSQKDLYVLVTGY
jgi:hypothetical protein